MNDKVTMTVVLPDLTEAQAIALEAMFRRWRYLGGVGSSRAVSFYADGDGNFRPKPQVSFSRDPYPTADEDQREKLRAFAEKSENNFDFDPVAWALRENGGGE